MGTRPRARERGEAMRRVDTTLWIFWGALALVAGGSALPAQELWFAEGSSLWRLDESGAAAVGDLPGGGFGFAAIPGGGVWVASRDEARLRRFDVYMTQYPMPGSMLDYFPSGIANGVSEVKVS